MAPTAGDPLVSTSSLPSVEGGQRRRRLANLKRRLFMIGFHRANRLPDGRSAIAVRGGKAAWRKRSDSHPGGERGLALELAMKRHYPDEL